MERIRITIVTELFMREMSPMQFFETVGGTSPSSIYRHFKKLVDHSWLRPVRDVSIGPGRPATLYRATELPVIDTETWGRFPISIRDAFTVQALEEMGTRLGEALGARTADKHDDHVGLFQAAQLDEPGWCRSLDAIERCYKVLAQVQWDAKRRLEDGREEPISLIVNLAAFELPSAETLRESDAHGLPPADDSRIRGDWPQRMGKVFSDPLSLAIIDVLNRVSATPDDLYQRLGGATPRQFFEKCQQMTELGWLVNVDSGRPGGGHRGARVVRYRAAAPRASRSVILRPIPTAARQGESWKVFDRFSAASLSALKSGTFNSRSDRHLTLNQLSVDRRGWTQVTEALAECRAALTESQRGAQRRIQAGAKASPIGLLVNAFEAPRREMARK